MLDDAEEREPPSLGELWAIVRRRRWCLLLSVFLCWAIIWAASWLMPSTYQSEALIVVEQQKVPEYYVEPNVAANLQGRLQSMTQRILSRTRLQTIIDSFHLYSSGRGFVRLFQTGDPVDQMRKDIKIEVVELPGHPGQLTAFKIYYSGDIALRAQRVNSQLATLFIDENVKTEQQLSESTSSFLASELTEARKKLEEQEAEVKTFKASHFGELPNQMQSNAEAVSSLQAQLENNQRALDHANQQKLYLESQLQQLQSAKAFLGTGDSAASSPDALDEQLLNLRHNLADERSRYTDAHPEIIALKRKIAETEKLKKDIEAEIAASEKAGAPSQQEHMADGARGSSSTLLIQLTSQLKANALEIRDYQRRQRTIESEISAYQVRLKLTPQTEQELTDITRGYEESKTYYNSLLQKQNQSQLATNLAQRQQGEQFRVLDPPSLPDRPAAPNHLLFGLGGLVLGGVVGVGLVVFLELTNVRVRHEKDLSELVPAPVLVCIPHLAVPGEARLDAAARRLELVTAVAMVLLIVVGNLYAFYKG